MFPSLLLFLHIRYLHKYILFFFTVSLKEMMEVYFWLQRLPVFRYVFQILRYFIVKPNEQIMLENILTVFQCLCFFANTTIALYVISRSVDTLLPKLRKVLKKDSKPTAFDPRLFDLLVEITNQNKKFNQRQEKMEAKIQQIVDEQKIIMKMQKKEEKLSLQHHRDIVNNQEQSDMKLENFKDELTSQQQELKKLCLETRSSLQNQIKQQGVLQNLVLDLKPTNENQQGATRKENDLNNECKICMERPLDTALTPCGHTVCFQCAKKLKFEQKYCPTCRDKISGLQKVFLN